jgi:hypothetical protein
MDEYDLFRHQLIKTLTAKANEKDAAIVLWQLMSTKIISIIGESGFNSLYVRSVILSSTKFSWLASYNPNSEIGYQFTELLICFEKQTPDHIKEANNQLLVALTDILASLIGETLTTSILCMAWGDVTSDIVSKEFKSEE